MTTKEIIDTVSFDGCASHLTFDYNGKPCGVDPLSRDHFEMWYGDSDAVARSLEEILSIPLFGGKTLAEIASQITAD